MVLVLIGVGLSGVIPATAAADCQASGPLKTTCTFDGGTTTWTAPAGVTQATFDLFGGSGAPGGFDGKFFSQVGGAGGETKATLPVAPGQTFAISVGGGSGGGDGNGGRATTLITHGELVLVAGGGGAAAPSAGTHAGAGEGGCGGGITGGTGGIDGGAGPIGGGGGGSQTAGGAAGIGSVPPPGDEFFIAGYDGSPGTLGSGSPGSGGAGLGDGGSGGDGYYGGGYADVDGLVTEISLYYNGGGGGGSGYISSDPRLGITDATTIPCGNSFSGSLYQPGYATVTYVIADNDLALHDVPSAITADATGPNGATVSYTMPTASDEGGETPGVACAPASGAMFGIKAATVTCTATDPDDSNSPVTPTFKVTVKGAAQQFADLQSEVQGVGPGKSLSAKVAKAQSALDSGKTADTCGALGAFVNEVRAQSGKSIPTSHATRLITEAQRIEAVIGC